MGKHKKLIVIAAVSTAMIALIFRIPRARKLIAGV
jgi:hypothetical protein